MRTAFIGSDINFYNHRNSIYFYDEATIVSGLDIDNDLGLIKPLSLIYLQNNMPALETNDENIFWFPYPITRHFASREELSSVVAERKQLIAKKYSENRSQHDVVCKQLEIAVNLIHPFRWYAYGHLHDTLSKLFFLDYYPICKDDLSYVIADPLRIKDFNLHLSALAGRDIYEEQVVNIGRQTDLSIEKFIHITPPTVPTQLTADVYRWLKSCYQKYFKISDCDARYKLYLARNGVRKGTRQVNNEQDVIEYLIAKGFTIVNGDEPLKEIVELFSNSSIVLGPHGSLFANTIFCPSNCLIIEFCPKNRIDKSLMLKHKDAQDYQQILVDSDSSFNIDIPMAIVSELLA